MKKLMLIIFLALILTGCNNTQEPSAETGAEIVSVEPVEQIKEEVAEEKIEEEPQEIEEQVVCTLNRHTETNDVELDQSIADEFSATMDADNTKGMYEGVLDIDIDNVDSDYGVHDQILLADTFKPETTLSFNQDDQFADKIFLPILEDSVRYRYIFEENLRTGNRLTDATESQPITIQFLGRNMDIIAASSTTLTILSPTKYRMRAGETVHVNGDSVTLVQAGTGSVTVEVNGQREVVQDTAQERVNGVEIKVQDISNEEGLEYDEATIIIGEDAQTTVSDGEEYFGEDSDDPLWVWDLDNLNQAQPTVGITINKNIDDPDEEPMYEGSSLCLPNKYVCFTYVKTLVDDYLTYTLDTTTKELYASQEDVQNNTVQVSGAKVLEFDTNKNGFDVAGTKTETIYLYHTGTELRVYEKRANKAVLAATITGSGTPFKLDYQKAEVDVDFSVAGTTATMTLDFTVGDDLAIYFETENTDEINYLGHSDGDTDVNDDILYGTKDISGFDKDVRLGSGAILEDPKDHQSSDDLVLRLPDRIEDFAISVAVDVNEVICR